MQRHEVYNATVLKISKTGEGHALVHFIVDEGEQPKLLAAFFFGLSKSKKITALPSFKAGNYGCIITLLQKRIRLRIFK